MNSGTPIDVTLLHTFRAVVEEGSFSAAGARLNCVQSNVTARIKRLEGRLGARLLERGRGGAKTTPFGALTYDRVSEALDGLSNMENDLREAAGSSSVLRLGAMETTAAARLPKVLASLRQRCPKAQVSLKTAPTGPLLDLVWRHELDAAFVAGPIDKDRFHGVRAFNEELVALWRSETAGDDGEVSDLPELGLPLLAFPEGCSYRGSAQAWLRSAGRADVSVTEMGSLDAIIGCAAAGMGLSVVPRAAADRSPEAAQMQSYALPKAFGDVKTFLIWRYDREPGQTLSRLIQILRS